MNALLDTHTFLWWITDNAELSPRAREVVGDGENILFLSAASGWEITIKAKLGRLQLPDNPERFVFEHMSQNAITGLPIQLSHALHVYTLPDHHRDPFDRVLIAQSQLEKLPIVTKDPQISHYSVEVIW
jgi:PIN domain nuclease of toxin-antitoxin system